MTTGEAQAPVLLDPPKVTEVLRAIMAAVGCTDEEADAVATHLVDASLTGHDSHGVTRIVRYHHWIGEGVINPGTALKRLIDTPSFVQLDGCHGVGQWLANQATAMGIARAKAHGVALVAMRGAGHIGRLGAYGEAAAREGIVSIQFANVAGSNLVAPFGAAERRISTAPVAIAVPNSDGEDFILDFATSYVAEGKALVAAKGGRPLPMGALVDAEGCLSDDPVALYGASIATDLPNPREGEGALRTMGEHKGSGLALACELLAGALTGNGTNAEKRPFGNGWFAVLCDPARLDDGGLGNEVGRYIDWVTSARAGDGVDKVRIPGDVERESRAHRRRHGLPLSPSVLDAILAIAANHEIPTSREALAMDPGAG
ncbi:MAG: Ldh family oxidoreductase [Pseudomonadota bacterium]